LIEMFFYPVTF